MIGFVQMEKGEQKMNELKKHLLAENDKLKQENIKLHDKVNELSEDMGYYKKAKSVEWETPQDFFDKCNAEFHFTLDVASTDENAKCENHFTEKDDGLKCSWRGQRVWCNPPYGRELPKWIAKADAEKDNAELIAMLIPARTDTKAFHEYIYNKAEIRFIKGRLKFGEMKTSAPFPSMLVIWR